jgi:hypothetical protein
LFLPIIAYTLFNKIRDKGKIVSAGHGGRGRGRGEGGEMTQTLFAHMNKKKDKLDIIKLKTCASEVTLKGGKRKPTEWRKIF